MNLNYVFQDVDEALPILLSQLENLGDDVGSRNGRCLELTHVGITLEKPWRREVTTPHRKPNIAAQIAETAWVLAGRSDMEFLSQYLPRAKDFSDDGETWRAGYGQRLRAWDVNWGDDVIDQWAECIRLLKEDPMTRRAVMSIWDPALDYADAKDIPCNDWLSFSSRLGYLDLMVGIRSNDIIWGWSGINAFEWSAMLEVTAGILGLKVGSLHFATTSLHMYETHFSRSKLITQGAKHLEGFGVSEASDSPRLVLREDDRSIEGFDSVLEAWFLVEEMIRNGYCPDAVVDNFSEPMLRSWLRVLQWWWSGDLSYLNSLEGTRLEAAVHASVAPPKREPFQASTGPEVDSPAPSVFIQEVCALHNEKHAAYGDSWKRRGEMLGIMANIARKIDRLGGSETKDETSADTAADLMVYLAKMRTWLDDPQDDTTFPPNALLGRLDHEISYSLLSSPTIATMESALRADFDRLEKEVVEKCPDRYRIVDGMLAVAYRLARLRWEATQDDSVNADHD